jgi:hypothetical protein
MNCILQKSLAPFLIYFLVICTDDDLIPCTKKYNSANDWSLAPATHWPRPRLMFDGRCLDSGTQLHASMYAYGLMVVDVVQEVELFACNGHHGDLDASSGARRQ